MDIEKLVSKLTKINDIKYISLCDLRNQLSLPSSMSDDKIICFNINQYYIVLGKTLSGTYFLSSLDDDYERVYMVYEYVEEDNEKIIHVSKNKHSYEYVFTTSEEEYFLNSLEQDYSYLTLDFFKFFDKMLTIVDEQGEYVIVDFLD